MYFIGALIWVFLFPASLVRIIEEMDITGTVLLIIFPIFLYKINRVISLLTVIAAACK